MSTRLRKIAGDVRSSKARTALVALAIAVGVIAVGMVASARTMMIRSLEGSRAEGAFASATLVTGDFGAPLLARVRRVPGVRRAEARRVTTRRVRTKDGWRDLTLTTVANWRDVRLARIRPERGAWPPPPGTILVERASAGALDSAASVRIAGTVHDVNSPSTTTSGMLYGYATGRGASNELLIDAGGGGRANAERVAARVRALLDREAVAVRRTDVPEPGTFWANDAIRSMVLLLTVLAVVCVFMSAFLVVNVVSALVSQQTRQIGVMKAIGATPRATAALYLGTALVFGTAAFVVAVPAAAVAALVLVRYSTGLVNLDAGGLTVPPAVLALEAGAAVLVPLAAALAPAVAGGRITVRDAISGRSSGGSVLDRAAERLRALPAAIRLAVTNTFRRTRRLLLTLTTIVLAGAVFLAVLSVRASLLRTLDQGGTYRAYDVEVALDRPAPAAAILRAVAGVPGLRRAEAWGGGSAYRRRANGSESESWIVVRAPAGSSLLRPEILRGRWLRPGDRNAVVLNTDVTANEQDAKPGREVDLVVDGHRARMRVVGIARRLVAGPVVYATAEIGGGARTLVAVGSRSDEEALAQRLSERLRRAGYAVGTVQTSDVRRELDRKNFGIIVSFLLAMAVLLAVVGGLGLAATLGINVLERSREIGVLRAVGAGDRAIRQLVLVEGLLVGAMGWLVAVPLALPVGKLLSDAVGRLFVGAPLSYTYSWTGAAVWLALVLVLAAAASLIPARRAARLTVRDALVYE